MNMDNGIMKEIKDFEVWYKKINGTGNKIEYLEFVYELIKTRFTEYHYSIAINNNTNNYFKDTLWSKFGEHEDAEIFLLNKLEKSIDTEFIGKILFCLGKIIDLKNGKQKEKVYEYTKKYANDTNDDIRENAIIVLGWLGSAKDVDLLGKSLEGDKNNKCRAWSASAFMQIWFRKKSKIFADKVLPYLYKSLKLEQDNFVIGSVIEALQEITGKKFGLTQKAVDTLEIDKINSVKEKAIKYFAKLYGE
jgi:flagellar biosynthesis/type III secretory pathway ATPase